jgi:hypothetical protein
MQAEDVFKNDNIEEFAKLVKDRWEQNFKDQPSSPPETTPVENNTNVNNNVKADHANGTEKPSPEVSTELKELIHHKLTKVKTEEFDPTAIKLDDSIQFASAETRVSQSKNAFLTGVTGILGVFILSELMEQTEFTVYCLVRDCKFILDMTKGFQIRK